LNLIAPDKKPETGLSPAGPVRGSRLRCHDQLFVSPFTLYPLPFLRVLCVSAAVIWLSGCAVKKDPVAPEAVFPNPIQKITAWVLDGCAELDWEYQGAAAPAKFIVLRMQSQAAEKDWSELQLLAELPAGANSYRDCSIALGNYYGYQVNAVSRAKIRSDNNKIVLVSFEAMPRAPQDFTATPGDRFVELAWTAEPGALFNLYRGQTPDKFSPSPLNQQPLGKNKFADLNLQNGATCYYCLRELIMPERHPLIMSACAKASAVPVDLIAPIAPGGLAAALTPEGVILKWLQSQETDLLGYSLYRRPMAAKTWELLNPEPITQNQYLDVSALKLHGKFKYAVQAVDTAPARNKSQLSQPASITLP